MTPDEALAIYNTGPKAVVKILCDFSNTIESQQQQIKHLEGRVGRGVTPSPSSNRTSGFPASCFPLDFTKRHTQTVSTAVTTSRLAPALAGAGNNFALSEDERVADCDDVND